MARDDTGERLSRISTVWTELARAHTPGTGVTAAQTAALLRYYRAVYRYLCGAVRDEHVAEELAQEFALKFVRGDFRGADPNRGRFRDYLRTALSRLVTDYHRVRQAAPQPLAADVAAPLVPDPDASDFLGEWRAELLDRTWEALGEANPAYKAALLLKVHEPDLSSADAAERLSAELGRPVTADWVRKAVQRAHEKFADLLVDETARSFGESAGPEQVKAELTDLDLLPYCRTALNRRGSG